MGDMGRTRATPAAMAVAAASCVFLAACSSSGSSPAGHSASPGPVPASSASSTGAPADQVQQYVDAVNALCDGLEQKVIALNGGKFDIPLKEYLAQLPRHTKLLSDFDHQLAAIEVPQAAAAKARALAAYVAFANKLDAARLAAARQGAAADKREIAAEEKTATSDPSIAGLGTAGFNQSCTAR